MGVMDSPGAGRVLIASGGPLVAEPTWTRYDNLADARCYGFDCTTGRAYELDTTDTGRASVYFHDRNQTFDSTSFVGRQIMLQLFDPVAEVWHPRWRGHIDSVRRGLVDTLGVPLADTVLECVGIFDYLGNVKMLPGIMGDVLPAGMVGVVFYEDEPVNERIGSVLDNALLDPDMYVVFSGNVEVNETLYDPDDSILQAVRDAADAEFPGVANFYEDRFGRAVFHGRHARFDPEATAATVPGVWDFTRWNAATRGNVTTGVAQVRSFSYNIPRDRIINSYLAWPRADEDGVEFDRALIPDLLKTDGTSITAYGYRGQEAPDLIVKKEKPAVGTRTAAEMCEAFGDFYVANYADPRKAVEGVTFMTHHPADARAAATWDLMCRCDVSDVIELTIDEASLADVAFFVDGVSVECRTGSPEYDIVTFSPNLTPATYFGTDVFDA